MLQHARGAKNEEKWINFIRFLEITLLVISTIGSDETVDTLHHLIYEHNVAFKRLYPENCIT